jgi:uncharacterized protein (TIGR02413 family)
MPFLSRRSVYLRFFCALTRKKFHLWKNLKLGVKKMTLNLIFLTVTFKKKQYTNAEFLQEIEMEKRIEENRRKLHEMGYRL